MDDGKWLQPASDSFQIARVKEANDYTKKFGLALTDEEAALLIGERKDALKEQERARSNLCFSTLSTDMLHVIRFFITRV